MTDQDVSFCMCQDGFILNDCSGYTASIPGIPATIQGPRYSPLDDYGDNHPIFNRATISQIYITMSEADLSWLMDPQNAHEAIYKPGMLHFYNGIQDKVLQIGIRNQGGVSRAFAKKSWKISFLDVDHWHQINGFILKSAAFDPSYLREQLSISIAWR